MTAGEQGVLVTNPRGTASLAIPSDKPSVVSTAAQVFVPPPKNIFVADSLALMPQSSLRGNQQRQSTRCRAVG